MALGPANRNSIMLCKIALKTKMPGNARRSTEVQGGPRRSKEVPGGPRKSKEAHGGSWRPTEVPGGPWKSRQDGRARRKTIVVVLMLSGPGSALRNSDIGSSRIRTFDSSGD